MIRVKFVASPFGAATSTEGEQGDRLMDLCDEARAPVPFSCRNASCGTCLVQIRRGGELLDVPGEDERSVLEALEAAPGCRLACRAKLVRNEGTLLVAMETIGNEDEM